MNPGQLTLVLTTSPLSLPLSAAKCKLLKRQIGKQHGGPAPTLLHLRRHPTLPPSATESKYLKRQTGKQVREQAPNPAPLHQHPTRIHGTSVCLAQRRSM